MFKFETVGVRQKASDFADFVHSVTRGYPEEERFGQTNQMRRAVVSISSNIAEGRAPSSPNDCARFIEMAAAGEHGKMLSGLRRSVMEKS